MSDFTKHIVAIAQSQKSRETLNRWPMFQLPEPNDEIDGLMKKLSGNEASPSELSVSPNLRLKAR